ncbi:MAG: prolyl oligopeptidase family serine peptidase [Roseibacillus sp.]
MKILCLSLLMVTTLLSNPSDWKKDRFQHQELTLPYASHRSGPKEEKIPLVLFLHGAGERGDDNKSQLTHGMPELLAWLEKTNQPCHIIAPQCPSDMWWSEATDYKDPEGIRLSPKQPRLDALLALVEKTVSEHPIDRSRIYLTGLSMGGYGTFALLSKSPETWAAALPVCGGGDATLVAKYKNIPLHITHGADDIIVPAEMSRHLVKALKEAGAAQLHYTEMLLTNHDSWTATYRNPKFWEWMFAQSKANDTE